MAVLHLTRKTTKRLGELLIDAGLINKDQLDIALAEYKQTGRRVGEVLVAKGFVTEHDVAVAIASQFNVPYIDAAVYGVDASVASIYSVDFMREHNFAPLDRFGNILLLAVSAPLSSAEFGQIEKDTGCILQCLVTSSSSLQALHAKIQEIQSKQGVAPAAASTEAKTREISDKAQAEIAGLVAGDGHGGKAAAGDSEWSSLLKTVADADFLKDLEQSMDKLEFKPGHADDDDDDDEDSE